MNTPPLVCPRCGHPASPGARTCAHCGEVVDPALAADLRQLYATLLDLDGLIAGGHGERSVRSVRDEYRDRYLAMRSLSPDQAPDTAPAPTASMAALATTTPPPPAAVRPVRQTTSSVPRPPRPAFSWQAFLADQAIAIMAYLGGFLLLVATLTFEVGGWQVLSNSIKFGVVCGVYLVFGVLGALLRRSPRLSTVARIYLGIFALMTPLVALAAYRFELQTTGFPPSGMLCLAALYAATVYLALALRTRLQTYAYLGWAALIVAVLALVPWLNASPAWWSVALGGVGLLLLGARRIGRLNIATTLGLAATQLAVVASLGALAFTEVLALAEFSAYGVSGFDGMLSSSARAAFATGAWVMVGLALVWSVVVRGRHDRARVLVTPIALSVAALAAQAALAVAAWAGADSHTVVYLLAALAVTGQSAAIALLRIRPARIGPRRGLEGLALLLALGSLGALAPLGYAQPSWTMLPSLSVAALVPLGIALVEDARWWLLAAGFFLTLDYLAIVDLLREPYIPQHQIPAVVAALPLALWATALGLHVTARGRRLALPLLVVALADALLTLGFLSANPDPIYQTSLLLIFAVAAYIAPRRLGEPVAAAALGGLFGTLAALPLVFSQGSGLRASALALGLAVVALVVRRLQGRLWAYGPYLAAFSVLVMAVIYSRTPGVDTAIWSALGVPYAAWLLLIVAALAGVASVWERVPWTTAVPAFLMAWAITLVDHRGVAIALVVLFAAAGMAARRWRGPVWGTMWYLTAAYGSLVVVKLFIFGAPAADDTLTITLLGFALLVYAVAALESQPLFTSAAVIYVLAATAAIPDPAGFAKTLGLTAALPVIGFLLGRRVGRQWAWALFATAIGTSAFAVARFTPYSPTAIEALLLIFAAAAYGVAMLERAPIGGVVSALYAAGAALAQPDTHALLPLALALGLAGLLAGRVAGMRWAYPFYAAATFSAMLTVILSLDNPRFESIALLALALAAYIIAAAESRPDVLPLAILLSVMALASGSGALNLTPAQAVLAFAGVAWVFALAGRVWRTLPWLRPVWSAWWTGEQARLAPTGEWADTRAAGALLHRWASLLVGVGAVIAAFATPGSFATHAGPTQSVALALCSLAALLALFGRERAARLPLYIAGMLVAIAVSWEARWLGAINPQAFILAPGTYLLLVGAILPADDRVRGNERMSQGASLAGALLLTLPTLAQSFTAQHAWLYALIIALEALVIAGIGVGTHARPLVVVGSCFVGLAALRGAVLAIQSGLPIPAVIGALAVLLLGGATWLSLRARHAADHVI